MAEVDQGVGGVQYRLIHCTANPSAVSFNPVTSSSAQASRKNMLDRCTLQIEKV